ncbi:MAG: methionine biosynthesis protein MetW [Pseudomonadota bacterium]
MHARNEAAHSRVDLNLIAELVKPGSKVLDVGCGDGSLLDLLVHTKDVDGRGIELNQKNVNQCVARGLSVIQGDADKDLSTYPDNGFDYAILSQTIQATHNPKQALQELMRIGRYVIVSFPNFGHWRIRLSLGLNGRMPVNDHLPYAWYDTPNIHFCTIADFAALCDEIDARIEKAVALNGKGKKLAAGPTSLMSNVFGQEAVFLLSR